MGCRPRTAYSSTETNSGMASTRVGESLYTTSEYPTGFGLKGARAGWESWTDGNKDMGWEGTGLWYYSIHTSPHLTTPSESEREQQRERKGGKEKWRKEREF